MPFILLLMAAIFIVCGYRGTIGQLGSLLEQDFTGTNNFGTWLFAFFIVGALGYIPAFKKLSDAFLLLIIVVIIIVNDKNGQGFFQGITEAESGTSTIGSTSIPSLNSGGLLSSVPTQFAPSGANNLTLSTS